MPRDRSATGSATRGLRKQYALRLEVTVLIEELGWLAGLHHTRDHESAFARVAGGGCDGVVDFIRSLVADDRLIDLIGVDRENTHEVHTPVGGNEVIEREMTFDTLEGVQGIGGR